MSTDNETITINKAILVKALVAFNRLTEECNESADFGDTQGRGHQSELDALATAEDSLSEVWEEVNTVGA
jgi:hypothetical protein